MAGLSGGWNIYGGKMTNKPRVVGPAPTPTAAAAPIDTGPTKTPEETKPKVNPRGQMGGLNAGMGSIQSILPQYNDPFRTYGTVQNGQVVPPSNPFAPPSNFAGSRGGTWESPGITNPAGPINSAPSQSGMSAMSSPYMEGGGFTGNRMPGPLNIPNYTDPSQANIPNMNQGGGMLRNAYRNKLFY